MGMVSKEPIGNDSRAYRSIGCIECVLAGGRGRLMPSDE